MNKSAIVLITLIFGVLIFITVKNLSIFSNQASPSPSPTPQVPVSVTEHGEYVCLPHKNKTGPQTLECALGLESHEGEFFSMDTSGLPLEKTMSFNVGDHIFVEGNFVPVEALSSDHWQKYDIKGIIRVEHITLDH